MVTRHCIALTLCGWSLGALAADVALVGLLPGRAMVVVDGGKRQTVAVGAATTEGVKLVAIESGAAVFETEGKRRRMQIGQSVVLLGMSFLNRMEIHRDGSSMTLMQRY